MEILTAWDAALCTIQILIDDVDTQNHLIQSRSEDTLSIRLNLRLFYLNWAGTLLYNHRDIVIVACA